VERADFGAALARRGLTAPDGFAELARRAPAALTGFFVGTVLLLARLNAVQRSAINRRSTFRLA
jgi:hypothetical protein